MKVNKIFCDKCKGEIENCECAENQMRFVLFENMDDGKEYQFCGAECLKEFVAKKEFENRFYRYRKVIESNYLKDMRKKAKKLEKKLGISSKKVKK